MLPFELIETGFHLKITNFSRSYDREFRFSPLVIVICLNASLCVVSSWH